MIYLDTGCLVKLYHPKPDSPKVAALVAGKPICFDPLHDSKENTAAADVAPLPRKLPAWR